MLVISTSYFIPNQNMSKLESYAKGIAPTIIKIGFVRAPTLNEPSDIHQQGSFLTRRTVEISTHTRFAVLLTEFFRQYRPSRTLRVLIYVIVMGEVK